MGQKCSDCSWTAKDTELVLEFGKSEKENINESLATEFSSKQYSPSQIKRIIKIQAA